MVRMIPTLDRVSLDTDSPGRLPRTERSGRRGAGDTSSQCAAIPRKNAGALWIRYSRQGGGKCRWTVAAGSDGPASWGP